MFATLQELIGHCSAVYCNNRATALALEEHLSQYGYRQPVGAVLEPANPYDCMDDENTGLLSLYKKLAIRMWRCPAGLEAQCVQSAHRGC